MKPADAQRFWSYIDRSAGPEACWPWRGGVSDSGYGAFWLSGFTVSAHRTALILAEGDQPGLFALHSCDRKACCNPAHLRYGTRQDNADDAVARNRLPCGEHNATSKLTEPQARDIIARRRAGESGSILARQYGITTAAVCSIYKGRNWKHLKEAA